MLLLGILIAAVASVRATTGQPCSSQISLCSRNNSVAGKSGGGWPGHHAARKGHALSNPWRRLVLPIRTRKRRTVLNDTIANGRDRRGWDSRRRGLRRPERNEMGFEGAVMSFLSLSVFNSCIALHRQPTSNLKKGLPR